MSQTEASSGTSTHGKVIPPGAYVTDRGGFLTPWKKGQTGNPGGITSEYHEVKRLCVERSKVAVERLFELMDCKDERVAFLAIQAVLERGIGKPRETDKDSPTRVDLGALSADERAVLMGLMRKVLGATADD